MTYANGDVRTRERALLLSSDPKPGPQSKGLVSLRESAERTNHVQRFGSIAQSLVRPVGVFVLVKVKR